MAYLWNVIFSIDPNIHASKNASDIVDAIDEYLWEDNSRNNIDHQAPLHVFPIILQWEEL